MAIDVTAERQIHADPARVASYAMDPGNDPEWTGGIETAKWVTEPPLDRGSRIERVARFLGRRIEVASSACRNGCDPGGTSA